MCIALLWGLWDTQNTFLDLGLGLSGSSRAAKWIGSNRAGAESLRQGAPGAKCFLFPDRLSQTPKSHWAVLVHQRTDPFSPAFAVCTCSPFVCVFLSCLHPHWIGASLRVPSYPASFHSLSGQSAPSFIGLEKFLNLNISFYGKLTFSREYLFSYLCLMQWLSRYKGLNHLVFCFIFSFLEWVLLGSSYWPHTHNPAFSSQVLRLEVGAECLFGILVPE